MNTNDESRQQMWELVYGLLDPQEEAALRTLIKSDPAIARLYAEVRLEADLVSSAARVDESPLQISAGLAHVAKEQRSPTKTKLKPAKFQAPGHRGSATNWLAVAGTTALLLLLGYGLLRPEFQGGTVALVEPLADPPYFTSVRVPPDLTEGQTRAIELETRDLRERGHAAELDVRLVDAAGRETFRRKLSTGADGLARVELPGASLRPGVWLQVDAAGGESAPGVSAELPLVRERQRTLVLRSKPFAEAGESLQFSAVGVKEYSKETQLPATEDRLLEKDAFGLGSQSRVTADPSTGVITGTIEPPARVEKTESGRKEIAQKEASQEEGKSQEGSSGERSDQPMRKRMAATAADNQNAADARAMPWPAGQPRARQVEAGEQALGAPGAGKAGAGQARTGQFGDTVDSAPGGTGRGGGAPPSASALQLKGNVPAMPAPPAAAPSGTMAPSGTAAPQRSTTAAGPRVSGGGRFVPPRSLGDASPGGPTLRGNTFPKAASVGAGAGPSKKADEPTPAPPAPAPLAMGGPLATPQNTPRNAPAIAPSNAKQTPELQRGGQAGQLAEAALADAAPGETKAQDSQDGHAPPPPSIPAEPMQRQSGTEVALSADGTTTLFSGDRLQVPADVEAKLAREPLVVVARRGETIVSRQQVESSKLAEQAIDQLPPEIDGPLEVDLYRAADGERLLYRQRVVRQSTRALQVAIDGLKETYAPGERVKLRFQVTDEHGRPAQATLGVRVWQEAAIRSLREPLLLADSFANGANFHAVQPSRDQAPFAAELQDFNAPPVGAAAAVDAPDLAQAETADPVTNKSVGRSLPADTAPATPLAATPAPAPASADPLASAAADNGMGLVLRENAWMDSEAAGPAEVFSAAPATVVVADNRQQVRQDLQRSKVDSLALNSSDNGRARAFGRILIWSAAGLLLLIGLMMLLRGPVRGVVWVPAVSVATICLLVGFARLLPPASQPVTIARGPVTTAAPAVRSPAPRLEAPTPATNPFSESEGLVMDDLARNKATSEKDSPAVAGDESSNRFFGGASRKEGTLEDAPAKPRPMESLPVQPSPSEAPPPSGGQPTNAGNELAAEGAKKAAAGKPMKADGGADRPSDKIADKDAEQDRPARDAAPLPSSLYWRPLSSTDASGQVTIEFTMPDRPAEYRLLIDAIGAGRLGGEQRVLIGR